MRLITTLVFILSGFLVGFPGCSSHIEGDGRPFTGYTDPGFRLATTSDLTKIGKDGNPDLRSLFTFDLNWAVPGSAPSLSQPFYLFGSVEGDTIEINKISVNGRNLEDFQVVGIQLPAKLEYNKYLTFKIQFAPVTEGSNREATVEVYSTRGHGTALRVKGNAVRNSGEISIWDHGYEAFNYANLPTEGPNVSMALGSSPPFQGICEKPFDSKVPLVIKNLGQAPLQIDRADILLDDGQNFGWENPSLFPVSIAPGQSLNVNLVLKQSAAINHSYYAHAKFLSQDVNEPVYEVGFGIFKPEPKPCLAIVPHEVGGEPSFPPYPIVPPNFHLPSLITAATVFELSLFNVGDADLILDASSLSILSQSPMHFPGACDDASVTIDLQDGGQGVVIAPNQSHVAILTIVPPINCVAQMGNQQVPLNFMIQENRTGQSAVWKAFVNGTFVFQSALLLVTTGANSVANNSSLTVGTGGLPLSISKIPNRSAKITRVTFDTQAFELQTPPTFPIQVPDGAALLWRVFKTPKATHNTVMTIFVTDQDGTEHCFAIHLQ